MQLYRIEIFDQNFNLKAYTSLSDFEYKVDYLIDASNEFRLPKKITTVLTDIKINDYVLISSENAHYNEIISAVNENEYEFVLQTKSLLTLFETDVLIDTNLQGAGTLEGFVSKLITDNFINNADILQNIKGLNLNILTATTDWGFNFKSDKQGMHTLITNLFNNVIIRAFSKYNLVLTPKLHVDEQRLTIDIAINNSCTKTLESNLKNVLNKKISIQRNDAAINKLTIHNSSDYDECINYYLHPDGKFDTDNNNRLTPVAIKTLAVDPEENRDFSKTAKSKAVDVFKSKQYNHLIELEYLVNDNILNFKDLEIGQNVNVIVNDFVYKTILTGFSLKNDTVIVRFGNIRTNLTTILKRRLNNDN